MLKQVTAGLLLILMVFVTMMKDHRAYYCGMRESFSFIKCSGFLSSLPDKSLADECCDCCDKEADPTPQHLSNSSSTECCILLSLEVGHYVLPESVESSTEEEQAALPIWMVHIDSHPELSLEQIQAIRGPPWSSPHSFVPLYLRHASLLL